MKYIIQSLSLGRKERTSPFKWHIKLVIECTVTIGTVPHWVLAAQRHTLLTIH